MITKLPDFKENSKYFYTYTITLKSINSQFKNYFELWKGFIGCSMFVGEYHGKYMLPLTIKVSS